MKAYRRKFTGLLLSILLVFSLLFGAIIPAEASESEAVAPGEYIAVTASEAESEAASAAKYIAVAAPESGNDYLIAYTEDTTAHIIDSEGMATESPGNETVDQVVLTVDSDIITTDDESLVWTVTSSGSDWLIQPKYGENSDRYLYPSTSKKSLYLSETDRAWTYSNQKLTYSSNYLRYSGSYEKFKYSSDNKTNTITFYELVDPSVTNAPKFGSSTYKMPDADATIAEFTLTNAYTAPVFKVYANNNDTQTADGITADLVEDGTTLTLTFEAAPTENITYYISVTDGELKESKRTAINIEAYVKSYVYTRVNTISSDSTYLIVATDGSEHYAMTTKEKTSGGGYLSADKVSDIINGDEIILKEPEAKDLEWVFIDSDNGFTIYNDTANAYASVCIIPDEPSRLYGLSLNSTGTVWTYDSSDNFIRYTPPEGEATYTNPAWLYYSTRNSGFRANTTSTEANAITLYQKQEDTVTVPPKFSKNTYRMPDADATIAEFTLTNANAYQGPKFNVYADNSGSPPVEGVTAGLSEDGTTLTLTFGTAPTQDVTYYISVTDGDLEESGRTAVKVKAFNEGASDYLAFTSDAHYGGTNNLSAWLNLLDSGDVLEKEQLDYMGFCGDMASASATETSYWSYAQTMLDTVTSSNLISSETNKFIYTTGNHEHDRGNYGSTTNTTAKNITRLGEAAETDNYIIYCFGAASSSQRFTDDDIDALEGYLDTAPDDIPIIIISHFPIHHFSSRTTSNAIDLINVLNEEHENVIFLWGHNHTLADTNYGKVYTAGSIINYTSSLSAEIDFTYAAAGCMSDSEYSSSGSGSVKQKGMIMEVADGGSIVTMTYYGLDGKATGAATTIEIGESVPSSNAELSSLSYSLDGSAEKKCPDFSPSTFEYSITLPYETPDDSQLILSGVCSDKDAKITDNEEVALQEGAATASITVTAEDGTTKTYTVNFTVSAIPDTPRYPIHLAFTSDTHYASGATNNLDGWLTYMKQRYDALDYVGITGDIGSTASTSVNQYWQFVQKIIDTVDTHSDLVTKGGIYTTGNHEQYAGPRAGGDYENQKNSNAAAMKLTQNGVAASTEDYIVYCFGASNDGSSSLVQEFTEEQIEQLETFLDGENVDSNTPVFIMSHYPLHYSGNRVVERSEDVIAILNEHPNVFFLWGHYHSDADKREVGYDNILKAGDTITTLNTSDGTPSTAQIQFTYAAAGCMSDKEYYDSSAAVLGKGIIAEITDIDGDKQVTLTYYNLDGESFSVDGKNTSAVIKLSEPEIETYTISWDTDGDGKVDDTTKVAYGTMPAHADGSKDATAQYTYIFTGWDPPLNSVTGETTYTAQFTSEVNFYTISWDTNGDGVVDDTTTADYGTMPAHANGKKDSTKEFTYSFTGWSPDLTSVTEAATYTAEFSATPVKTNGGGGGGGGGTPSGGTGKKDPSAEDIQEPAVPSGPADSRDVDERITYDDVPGNSWYYDAVQYVTGSGLFQGVSDNRFEPHMTITRAMFVTVLWRLEGEPVPESSNLFTDVADGAWYTDAVTWASANDIVKGYDADSFGPNDTLTREQLATILYRYASYKGYDMTATDDLTAFNDAGEISPWALTEVSWAVAEGLIAGVSETSFDPAGNASRAQVAMILMRFVMNKVK